MYITIKNVYQMSIDMYEFYVTVTHLKIEEFLIKKEGKWKEREGKRKIKGKRKLKTLGESGHLHLPVFWVLKSFHFLHNQRTESFSHCARNQLETGTRWWENSVIPLATCIYLLLAFLPHLIIAVFRWRTRGTVIDVLFLK